MNVDELRELLRETPVPAAGREAAVAAARADLARRPARGRTLARHRRSLSLVVPLAAVALAVLLTPPGQAAARWVEELIGLRSEPSGPAYPPPTPPRHRHGYLSKCPSLQGVQRLRPGADRGAKRALARLDGVRRDERRYVDPSLWDELPIPPVDMRRVSGEPASIETYRAVASYACRAKLVRRSWALLYDAPGSASLDTTYYLLKRHGHWLLWFHY